MIHMFDKAPAVRAYSYMLWHCLIHTILSVAMADEQSVAMVDPGHTRTFDFAVVLAGV